MNSLVKQIDRVIFVSVIHTDSESVNRARKIVRDVKPAVVAVELDHQRYQDLLSEDDNQDTAETTGGSVTDLMQQLALLEKALGEMSGSSVGSEMLAAIDEGRELGAKIALIDRPIAATMQAMSQIPLDEIYRLSGMVSGMSGEIGDDDVFDIFSFLKEDGQVENLMEEFKKEFPGLFAVLITQRDEYVAKALHYIMNDVEGTIVAVLGAGHIEGVQRVLKEILESESAS